jgi:hypothetical protein
MKRKLILLLGVSLLLALIGGSLRLSHDHALALSDGDYDVAWSVIGSAGDEFVSGGDYQMGFTLAQDQAPLMSSDGSYQIVQGYWSGGAMDPPTAVTLAAFWVEARGDTLVVCWETASEVDTVGFNLYRSEGGEPGSFSRLSQGVIPSRALGNAVGASYEWADTSAVPGHTYFYLIEDVDFYGQATQHDSVQGTLYHYLPLILKEP